MWDFSILSSLQVGNRSKCVLVAILVIACGFRSMDDRFLENCCIHVEISSRMARMGMHGENLMAFFTCMCSGLEIHELS